MVTVKKEPKRTISLSFIVMIITVVILGIMLVITESKYRKQQEEFNAKIIAYDTELAETRSEMIRNYQVPDTIVREKYFQKVIETKQIIKHEYAKVKKDSIFIFNMSPDSLSDYGTKIKERIDRLNYENAILRAEADSITI